MDTDFDWQLENPTVALEKYYENIELFKEKKEENAILSVKLNSKKQELDTKNSNLKQLEANLKELGEYMESDIDSMIQSIKDNSQKKITEEQEKYNKKKNDLLMEKEKDIESNNLSLENRLNQLFGNKTDAHRELTDVEKKALEFKIARRKFMIESNEKINHFQDSITQEELDSKTVIGNLEQNKYEINTKYEPIIAKHKQTINNIFAKYQPDIEKYESMIAEKTAARDEKMEEFQLDINTEVQIANSNIAIHEKDYKITEKQYNEQIKTAKQQDKPTTRLENSKNSKLNAINGQIQKIQISRDKKIATIEQRRDAEYSKHTKAIEKIEIQRDSIIKSRDQELSQPISLHHKAIEDRDTQISSIEAKINQRLQKRNEIINNLNINIENEKTQQNNFNLKIDQQTIDFVMSGDTCFSDILNESVAPFMALQEKVDTWMELLKEIKKEKIDTVYEKEHEKQKNILIEKEYTDLQNELSNAQQFNPSVSIFAKYNEILIIVSSVLFAIGVFGVIFSKPSFTSYAIGIIVALLGIATMTISILKTKKEFSSICKYISLATDYNEFPSISSHSKQVTQKLELEKMKEIGDKLYDVQYGKMEAEKIHASKNADINEDYERNLKIITKDLENARAKIEQEQYLAIQELKNTSLKNKDDFNNNKQTTKNAIQELIAKTKEITNTINKLQNQIENNTEFIHKFESNYKVLEQNLQEENWKTPMTYTHGKFCNNLFVIPENASVDAYYHKPIYKIEHNKKALVITYDINCIADGTSSQIEEIGKVIHNLMFDLMYSVYRMNSKDCYLQFIVDEVGGTDEFKRNNIKNTFNIKEIAKKLDDIKGYLKSFASQREKLAENGIRIDDINEKYFKSGDRPEIYNILYIIYKPNERKSKLEEDLKNLLPECDKYGFFPIFICEKETWERELLEKESIYKDIKSFVHNPIVVFNNSRYSEMIS